MSELTDRLHPPIEDMQAVSNRATVDLTLEDLDLASSSVLEDDREKVSLHKTQMRSSTPNNFKVMKRKHDSQSEQGSHDDRPPRMEKKAKSETISKPVHDNIVDLTEDDLEKSTDRDDFQQTKSRGQDHITQNSSDRSLAQVLDIVPRIDLTGSAIPQLSSNNSLTPTSENDLDDDTDIESEIDEPAVDHDVKFIGQRRIKKRKPIRQVLYPTTNQINNRVHERVMIKGMTIENGSCIEFIDGTFMRIHTIYSDPKHQFVFIGLIFTRITEKETPMPKQRDSLLEWRPTEKQVAKLPRDWKGCEFVNEVCQRVRHHVGEAKRDYGLWRRSAKDFKRLRDLRITNQSYEQYCMLPKTFEVSRQGQICAQFVEKASMQELPLICRWKEVVVQDEYGARKDHRLEKPSSRDIDVGFHSSDHQLQQTWRGPTLNLALPLARQPHMIDGFCGAGGMSSAAIQAGIKVVRSFDCDDKKIATHSFNFPQCESMHVDVKGFLDLAEVQDWRVDILHLSPPCQPFSPANTTPNQSKNEANQAPLLACGLVIQYLRPRIVTIEESAGITGRHIEWFEALIHQFTVLGFSVRWATLACRDFGVPQLRRRLFLIAAAPGEDLPKFPEPTHLPGEVSIQKTLNEIEQTHRDESLNHHDPREGTSRAPYSADCLAKTVTCKGGENYHPNGKRQFTTREFLALQTFPNDFKFPMVRNGTPFPLAEMRTQLGNAVPPLFGKAILESIVSSLKTRDRRTRMASL